MKTQSLCIFSGCRANSNKPPQRLHSGAFNGRYEITICWPKTSVAIIHNSTSFINVPSPMSWLVLLWLHLELPPGPCTQSLLRQPKRAVHPLKIASSCVTQEGRMSLKCKCFAIFIMLIYVIFWSNGLCRTMCKIMVRHDINPSSVSKSSVCFPMQNELTFRAKSYPQCNCVSGSFCRHAVRADSGGSAKPQCGQHMATNALISELDA